MFVKACIAGALALVQLSCGQSAPTDGLTVPIAGVNENIKVDVRRIPVPLESRYRGNAFALVQFVDPASVDYSCGTIPNMRVIACVNHIGGDHLTLPNPCNAEFQGEDYAAVVCHEKGHVLGWRHQDPSFTRLTREG